MGFHENISPHPPPPLKHQPQCEGVVELDRDSMWSFSSLLLLKRVLEQ